MQHLNLPVLLAIAALLVGALIPSPAAARSLSLPPGIGIAPAYSLLADGKGAAASSALDKEAIPLPSSAVDHQTVALLVKLQTAQFHHLRAMHGIGWAITGMLVSPSLIVIGGGVMIAGFFGGLFTGSNAVLIGGIVMVGIGAALLIAGIPTLVGNIIQAMATSAAVETLKAQLLNRSAALPAGPPPATRHAGLAVTFAF